MNLRQFAQNHLAKSKVAQRPDNAHLFQEVVENGISKAFKNAAQEERRVVIPAERSKLLQLPREEPYQIGSEEKLNQTERDYLVWLRTLGDVRIWVQAFTLKLGHKCSLTMDFAALDAQGLRFIDTKASWNKGRTPHIAEDANVKMKWAAQLYAPMRFLVAWKGKDGTWRHKEIFP